MTATTHIAVSCLITTLTIQTISNDPQRFVIVAGASLLSHFLLDLIPHGFIAKPTTLFKKLWPTVIELLPGPVILITAILLYDNMLLFLCASFFGVLPDLITTVFYKRRQLIASAPPLLYLHFLHRKVHWFEIEHPDGSCSYRFATLPLLAGEGIFMCGIVFALFKGSGNLSF